eukprot:TRINITY_DN23734_c0_g2_i1.p1 TRINITY_DN23734_c0_g2~~TRINITY_DN23734_c0_g2_i1.p1  ORF type:complete len:860 (-),score=130.18 TRINITY_DN23734_c0_g2_i1:58-2637(-)
MNRRAAPLLPLTPTGDTRQNVSRVRTWAAGSESSESDAIHAHARQNYLTRRRATMGRLTALEREEESDEEESKTFVKTFARRETAPLGTESTGYDLYESKQYIDHLKLHGRLSDQFSRKNCLFKGGCRWISLCCIGICSGLVAIGVDVGIEHMFAFRHFVNGMVANTTVGLWKQYLAWVSLALLLASAAGCLVCYVQVLAAGSGIPEIKCYLNGVDFPSVVGLQTLVAKAVGIVFSVSAGLPCGKEGPMIHSGAIIGAVASKLNVGRTIEPFVYSQETRDLVAAGAASGVAAAFGAPLGSVLFAVEEGTSHMNPEILMRLFVASGCAALTSRFFIGPLVAGLPFGVLGWRVPVSFGRFTNLDYHIQEMLVFAMMAVVGGLLGACFNAANKRLSLWRKRHIPARGSRRFLEVLLVTFTISSLQFWIPVLASVDDSTEPLSIRKLTLSNLKPTQGLFWRSGSEAMKEIFHSDEDFDLSILSVFAALNLVLSCWTYGIGVPSGLFVPSLLTGSAFGRIIGQLLKNYVPGYITWAHPGVYALIGACSMLAGTARITISLAMILMETSGDAVFGLPIFLAVMVAKWTGDAFNRGIYDLHIIELKKVPLLESMPEECMMSMGVRDVMTREVVTLELVDKVSTLLEVLTYNNHHGFPVLYPGTGRLAGMLSQEVLRRILELGVEHDAFHADCRQAKWAKPIPWRETQPDIEFKCSTIDEVRKLVEEHLDKMVNLRPYVNRNGLTVSKYASVWSAFLLFRQLGLRHLPVIGREGELCGILTRKDLIVLEEDSEDEGHHGGKGDKRPLKSADHAIPEFEEGCEEAVSTTLSENSEESDSSDTPVIPGGDLSRRTLETSVRALGGAAGM